MPVTRASVAAGLQYRYAAGNRALSPAREDLPLLTTSPPRMHRLVMALAFGFSLATTAGGSAQTQPSTSTSNSAPLRVYEVNKAATEFPDREDLSTPEAACAAINRLLAHGREGDWRRLSAPSVADRLPLAGAASRPVEDDAAQMWLNAVMQEVRVFRGRYAAVLAKRITTAGKATIDVRHLELHDGQWLNCGHDESPDLDRARTVCALVCGRYREPTKPPPFTNPKQRLAPFVAHLEKEGREPIAYLLDATGRYPLVIVGEIHHRPRYWALLGDLVAKPDFARQVGTIYMELPSNDQSFIDEFLAADRLDTAPVIETLRDNLWMGWPDQAMLDFFVAVWKANQPLPPDRRMRIVLADMARPWKEIRRRNDWNKYDVDRNRFMADTILRDRREHQGDRRHAVFIVGAAHAMLDLKYPDETTPMRSAGWHLRQALGPEAVWAIFPHGPVQTNAGQVSGRIAQGLFDSAFAAHDNRPVAFPLTSGPFGLEPFDAFPDWPAASTYREGYSAYLYLGPLEDEIFSPLIPDFYTDEFVRELDRRHQIMFDRSLVEGCDLDDLDGKSFTRWMARDWGRPRRAWREHMGPIDAWKQAKARASSPAAR